MRPQARYGYNSQLIAEGRRKKEEGRRKKEEGRRKKEEGRRKKEEAVSCRAFKLHILGGRDAHPHKSFIVF